jgi:hypothetical protein
MKVRKYYQMKEASAGRKDCNDCKKIDGIIKIAL